MKTPNARLFTVSSIFCLFHSTLFTNNFEVVNAAGDDPDPGVANDLTNNIEKYFRGLKVKSDPAVPRPDNVVLGYGMTQDLQRIQDIDRNATWKDTPAYFIPATFDLTTTKARGIPTGKDPSGNNTLNFCMVTHLSKGPDDKWRMVNLDDNHSSGNLVKMFAERMRKFDGYAIMAWSREIFWKKWVLEYIRPTMTFDMILMVNSFVKQWSGKEAKEWSFSTLADHGPQEGSGNFINNMNFVTNMIFIKETYEPVFHQEWLHLDGKHNAVSPLNNH